MANAPVEVTKAAPAPTSTADLWRSFRNEFDRMLGRFLPDLIWSTFPRAFGYGPFFNRRHPSRCEHRR